MHKGYIFYISLIFYSSIISVPVIERHTINSMADMQEFITPSTLAIFDIDDTLIHDMDRGTMTFIEPTITPSVFKKVKNKAWGTLGLTARNTNYDYQLFTLNQLTHHNLTFTPFFDDSEKSTSCILLNDRNKAFYNNGVIFVKGTNKGNALEAFLEHLPEIPETIVFVDDKRYNIDNVFSEFKNNSKFAGLKKIILCDYPYVEEHHI